MEKIESAIGRKRHGKLLDLEGKRFGRLLIGKLAEFRGSWSYWHATCDCGTVRIVKSALLRNGKTKSCGCLSKEITASRNRATAKQGGEAIRRTPEYRTWVNMKDRCDNPNNKKYRYYGGMGVDVCARWRKSYFAFLSDMGRRPSDKHSIDRFPNKNGDYEPNNCRWATYSQQNSNRRKYGRRKSANV